jgi:hypothetical protein
MLERAKGTSNVMVNTLAGQGNKRSGYKVITLTRYDAKEGQVLPLAIGVTSEETEEAYTYLFD